MAAAQESPAILHKLSRAFSELGVRTTAATESGWIIGRFAIVAASLLAIQTFLPGSRLAAILNGLLVAAVVYSTVLSLLLLRGKVYAAFWVGFVLDNILLVAAWLAVINFPAGNVTNTDLLLGSYPIIIAGVARTGWVVGGGYTALWLVYVAWTTLTFYDHASYEVQQLPLRLIFLGTSAAVTLQVVARLSSSQRRTEMLWQEARRRGDRLQEMGRLVDRERMTLQAIQTSMTEGLLVLDSATNVAYMNPAVATLLRLREGMTLGRPLLDVLRDAGTRGGNIEETAGLETVLLSLVEASENQPQDQEIILAPPGPRLLAVTAFPIPAPADSDGHWRGLLWRDITQEREALRRRDEFISIASHELRTPMTGVLGFSELLLTRQVSEETRKDWLMRINKESHRLTALVDEMLNVAHIQSGHLSLHLEALSARKTLEEALHGVRYTTDIHQFVINTPPDLPPVLTDGDKLAQILANLLDNAIKYSPNGGLITLSASQTPDGRQVIISVADQGIGIAEADRGALFTTFRRIQRPETERIKGTGLGLYIVKSLAEAMGGEVWAESEMNKGSVFYVALPAATLTEVDKTPVAQVASRDARL